MIKVTSIELLEHILKTRKELLIENDSKYSDGHKRLLKRSIDDIEYSLDLLQGRQPIKFKLCSSCKFAFKNKILKHSERFCENRKTNYYIIEETFLCSMHENY